MEFWTFTVLCFGTAAARNQMMMPPSTCAVYASSTSTRVDTVDPNPVGNLNLNLA